MSDYRLPVGAFCSHQTPAYQEKVQELNYPKFVDNCVGCILFQVRDYVAHLEARINSLTAKNLEAPDVL